MRRTKRLLIALPFFVSACSLVTEPARPEVEFSVTSENRGADASSSVPLTANAGSGSRTIVVMGRIRTSTPCWDLEQHVSRVADRIDITIAARERTVACAQTLIVRDYTLRLNGIAPGRYAVRVAHEYTAVDGHHWREAVLERDVRVE